MLGQLHIHRPSLDRYVITHLGSLQGVDYKRVGGKYHIIQWGQIVKQLDLKKDNDVFDFPAVVFSQSQDDHPWF